MSKMDEGQQGAANATASTSATVAPWQGQSGRPLAQEMSADQTYQASKDAPIAPLASSSSSFSSTLPTAIPSPSPHMDVPSPSTMLPASTSSSSNGNVQKQKGAPGKRVLPARLRRVSALLGGESMDDGNGSSGREDSPLQRSLPDTTLLVISKREQDAMAAYDAPADDEGLDSLNFFQDPKMVMACREKALIETPDFKLREDSSQMGKTRGGAMRSEEDTSDAAYERRHRKPDNLEKKQRRMEKERLIKERQRLRDRIEQLKTADPRMLMPIMSARESQLASSSTTASSLRGAEAAIGLGKQHMSAEATNNLNKIEKLRKELIAETTETLARYDAVLSVAVPVVESSTPTPAGAGMASSSHSARSKVANRAGSPSTTSAARKRASSAVGNAATPPPRKPRTSSSAASPPLLSSPEIMVKAENEHRNIHARTSGGRFAPRSAVIDPNNPEAGFKPSRKPRPSEIAKRAAKEAERQARAAGLLPPKKRTPNKGKGGAAGSPGAVDAATIAAASAVLAARTANRVGPSLSELDAAERRPKRVKLILGQRPGTETEDDDAQAAAAAAEAAAEAAQPRFAAPGALSLEQAQKMMMAAMAAARGESTASASDAANETGKTAEASAAEAGQQEAASKAQDASGLQQSSGSQDATMKGNDSAPAPSSTVDTTMDTAPGAPSTSTSVDAAPSVSTDPTLSTDMPSTSSNAAAAPSSQPLRRTSSRVRGAFGEKLPPRVFQSEDFEAVMVREGVVQIEVSVAERQQQEAKDEQQQQSVVQGRDIAMGDTEKGNEGKHEGQQPAAAATSAAMAAPQLQPEAAPAPQSQVVPSTANDMPVPSAQQSMTTAGSTDLMDVDDYVNAEAFNADP